MGGFSFHSFGNQNPALIKWISLILTKESVDKTMHQNEIFNISSPEDFDRLALEIFRYQHENVPLYRKFCDLLRCNPKAIKNIAQIPFLPIQFFKSSSIIANRMDPETIFTSSGTAGMATSKHLIADLKIYEKSFREGFQREYGSPSDYTILALLPSYLERTGSSLIYMVEKLIADSRDPDSGFYLYDMDSLITKIDSLERKKKKTMLIGVSYALLDLLEIKKFKLRNTIVMETGGMKGKRKEMIKEELHEILKTGFGVSKIHSEYGMTELLSQAYSKGDGVYSCPPWMKILIRDPEDAQTFWTHKTGGINVIDLANLYSCAFIATQDLGTVQPDNTFKIMGRFDDSDIRGCNLMVL